MVTDCLFCFVKSLEKLFDQLEVEEEKKNKVLKEALSMIGSCGKEKLPVELATEIHRMIRKEFNNPDPYFEIKQKSNKELLGRYDELKSRVENSKNKFETALRLAIAGNIIDYGAAHDNFDLDKTINHVLKADFSIDHSHLLREELTKAKLVLYLGDNTGEIVLDRIFIETINHPNLVFSVRGNPVLNDVTIEDAIFTGMDKATKVISNGYDAPSTLVNKSSAEFQKVFNRADVIISKGQGNLEGLMNNNSDNIFFALMVKCDFIANQLGVKNGDFVIKNNKK